MDSKGVYTISGIEVFKMGIENQKILHCVEIALDYVGGYPLERGLEMIIDIFDEIRGLAMDKGKVKQKLLKILYNLVDSDSLDSILEKEERKALNRFIKDFLKLCCDSGKYCFLNEEYKDLTLDEFYNVLIQLKFKKEVESFKDKKLPING